MNDGRGALWRKWDLHVHTPESFTHRYSGTREAQWSRFLVELEALPPEFKVIGINDYVLLDGYKRVLDEKRNGRLANIDLILPVIEMRLAMFAGTGGHLTRVNLHVIFSDRVTPETIETQFLSALPTRYNLSPEVGNITWSAIPNRESLRELGELVLQSTPMEKRAALDPVQLGFNSITFSLDAVRQVLDGHYFKEKHLIAVGKTEWAAMRWEGPGVADKKHVINSADLVFTAAESPQACVDGRKKLRADGVKDRLFDCSDAHAFTDSTDKDRIGNCFTWVKADTTFAGLCHALKEYEARVYLGDAPPKLGIVKTSGSRFIRSVAIRKRDLAACQETWFDCDLQLNHDLVAIIGRKGSGKSALTDVIALLCDAKREKSFSFLNTKRFRDPKDNKSRSFTGRLRFETGPELERGLDASVDSTAPVRVNYIPQSFFEEICGEIVRGEDSAFQKELEDVVFARLPVAQRLGFATLRELVAYRASEVDGSLRLLREQLDALVSGLVATEKELLPESRSEIAKALERRTQELADHDAAKPPDVLAPIRVEGEVATPDQQELTELQSKLAVIDTKIGEATTDLQDSTRVLAALTRIEGALTNLEKRHAQDGAVVATELQLLDLQWSELAALTIDRAPLIAMRNTLTTRQASAAALVDEADPASLLATKKAHVERAQAIADRLSEPDRKYREHLVALKAWQTQRGEIVGDATTPGTVTELSMRLARLDGLPLILQELRRQRLTITGAIFDELAKLAQLYRDLYRPVQDFVDRHEVVRAKLRLRFRVHMKELGFQDRLLQLINRSVRGTFSGSTGPGVLKDLVESTDFDDRESTLAFAAQVDACLHRDSGKEDGEEYRVGAQVRKGVAVEDLYRQIFALDFLKPEYTLSLGEKSMSALSPGERGALLLIFYLLVDDSRAPVILDQPDENLDNETVFELLVPCIREAKQDRQVIVVTHNPNIAVVCDAEQVIHAAIEKGSDYRITYTSGAIENPTINKHLLDVLEGTRPAFQNRDDKYL